MQFNLLLNVLLVAAGANMVNAIWCSNSGVRIFHELHNLLLLAREKLLIQSSPQDQTNYCRTKCTGGSYYLNCYASYVCRTFLYIGDLAGLAGVVR